MRIGVILTILLLLAVTTAAAAAGDAFLLKSGQRVLFLGDSITQDGRYIGYVDAYLRTRFPGRKFDLINLGLASEGVTGLSEPDHPFPRPDLHERIDRALRLVKPDVVVLCYGMNDGIYYPFDAARFAHFKSSVTEMMDRIRRAGARVILMTPPPFDPGAVGSHLLPAGAPKYSYAAPFAQYDDALAKYSRWIMSLRSHAPAVVELHQATWDYLNAVHHEAAGYHLAGDGIHPNASGHALIARQLLTALRAPSLADAVLIDAAAQTAAGGQVSDLLVTQEEIRLHWLSRLPMPVDPQWDAMLRRHGRLELTLNRYTLTVRNAPAERYSLSEGDTVLGEVSRRELEEGVDMLRFRELSTNRRALEILKLVQERMQILSPAWLSYVGHKRPGISPGLPIEEARRKAGALEADLQRLCVPIDLDLRFTRIQ